jgi:PKD domain-containing protein
MRTRAVQLGVLGLAVIAGGFVVVDDAAAKARRTVALSQLAPPRGGTMPRARGEIVAKTGDDGRQIVIVRLHRLRPGPYTLLCDDPATPERIPVAFAEVRAGHERSATLRLDSAHGDAMPNSATVDTLARLRFEVRDAAGFLVLSGGMPDPNGVKAALAPDGCRFVEEVVQLDDFDADTPGAAPANWDVSGPEITVDATIHDGTAGNSVLIDDADPLLGAPEMGRTFPSQDHFFAIEFTLTSPATAGRVVFRLGQGTAPTTFATGFGDGLGFYENGTIGFGTADTIQPSTPSTAYRIRVDVDLDTDLFDVSIDGTAVVTDRALGFAGDALDRIVFATGAETTGSANVDSVAVIHKTVDCPPTANAGADQTVEATGPTTAVTLDGSASSDPEGAALTYTWTGPFDEGSATGVNPTVHFTGLGTFEVTLVVNDGFFDSDPDTALIVLQDTTPPVLTVTGLPTSLWPPNHQLVTLHPTVTATDLVDQDVAVTLEVTSNEPDDGLGDGSTTGDIVIRSPSDFDLRAERAGPGSGRTYHLVWTATDDSGNATVFTYDLVVPHDQGNGGGGPHGQGLGASKGRHRGR